MGVLYPGAEVTISLNWKPGTISVEPRQPLHVRLVDAPWKGPGAENRDKITEFWKISHNLSLKYHSTFKVKFGSGL